MIFSSKRATWLTDSLKRHSHVTNIIYGIAYICDSTLRHLVLAGRFDIFYLIILLRKAVKMIKSIARIERVTKPIMIGLICWGTPGDHKVFMSVLARAYLSMPAHA